MQITDSSDEEKVIRGLFLVRGEPQKSTIPSDWTLKLTADFYSNLGFLAAIKGEFTNLGPLNKWNWLIGMGLTRTVYDNQPFSINPFNPLLTPWEQSQWNVSWIGTTRIPFRWGINWNSSSNNWSFGFEYYTDPYFINDLTANRSESFTTLTLLGLTPAKDLKTLTEKSSLQWFLRFQNISLPTFSAYLQVFQIQNIEVSGAWYSTINPLINYSGDPMYKFYIPKSFTLPKIDLKFEGTIADTSYKPLAVPQGKKAQEKEDSFSPLSPWLEQNTSSAEKTDDPLSKKEDGSLKPLPGAIYSNLLNPIPFYGSTGNIKWSLLPSFYTLTFLDKSKWISPQQNEWNVLNSRWNAEHSFRLYYEQNADSNLWSVKQEFNFKQRLQQSWYLDSSINNQNDYLIQDAKVTYSNLSQTSTTTLRPFWWYRFLKDSQLAYKITSRLWDRRYTRWDNSSQAAVFQDLFWDGSQDSVPTHEYSASLIYAIRSFNPQIQNKIEWKSTITPRPTDQTLINVFSLQYSWLYGSTSVGIRNKTGNWQYDLWTTEVTWNPFSWFSWKELYSYNLQNNQSDTLDSQIKIANLTIRLYVTQTLPYYFDKVIRRWIQGTADNSIPPGQTVFLPSQLTFSMQQEVAKLNFWFDRIEINTSLNLSWDINLQQYTSMPLRAGYKISSTIYRFWKLELSHSFKNNSIYRYFPSLTQELGNSLTVIDFFQDMLNSISFWNQEALKKTLFKVSSIDFSLEHYLEDWQLELKYSGTPQIINNQYTWQAKLTFLIKWYSFPEIKTKLQVDPNGQISNLKE